MRVRLLALVGLTLALNCQAAVKPETAIHYRQSLFHVIMWNFAPLNDMVRGKAPFDARQFALRAQRIAELAPQLGEGFPPGSESGVQTDAKPEIWKDPADFQAKLDAFTQQSRALAEVAKGGDEAKIKEQFQKTAGTCKGCHEKFRAE